MSSRPGIQITREYEADGGEHPNKYRPNVSAHIRVYWPPLATQSLIVATLDEAYWGALEAIRERGDYQ